MNQRERPERDAGDRACWGPIKGEKPARKKRGGFFSPSKRRVLGRNSEPLIREAPLPRHADVNSRTTWAREIPNRSQPQGVKHNRLNGLFSTSHGTVRVRGEAVKARTILLITGIGRWKYGLLHPSNQAGSCRKVFQRPRTIYSAGAGGCCLIESEK